MSLLVEEKIKIIKEFALNELDTGSTEVQIALLTFRINRLTDHFGIHKKDSLSKRGFIKLIQKRNTLLRFLKKEDNSRYLSLIKKLDLRK